MRAAAESVMNVLDITMPGTLSDEKKAQVSMLLIEHELLFLAVLGECSWLGEYCTGGTVECLSFRGLWQPSCIPILRLNSVAKSRIEYLSISS